MAATEGQDQQTAPEDQQPAAAGDAAAAVERLGQTDHQNRHRGQTITAAATQAMANRLVDRRSLAVPAGPVPTAERPSPQLAAQGAELRADVGQQRSLVGFIASRPVGSFLLCSGRALPAVVSRRAAGKPARYTAAQPALALGACIAPKPLHFIPKTSPDSTHRRGDQRDPSRGRSATA